MTAWHHMLGALSGQPLPELPALPGRQFAPLREASERQEAAERARSAAEPRKPRRRGAGSGEAEKTRHEAPQPANEQADCRELDR